MYAIVRLNTFDELKLAGAAAELERFSRAHASQPGYVGTLTVAIDGERQLTVNIWQSEEHARRGLASLGPEVGRVLEPLMLAPSELIGAGRVLQADLPRLAGA